MNNTIIFVFNDRGVEDGKGSLYHGGIRSVSVVWSPRFVREGRQTRVNVSNIDFAPTILDLCGVSQQQRYPLDGKSFAAVLRGSDAEIQDHLFFELGATRAVLNSRRQIHCSSAYLVCRNPLSRQMRSRNTSTSTRQWRKSLVWQLPRESTDAA